MNLSKTIFFVLSLALTEAAHADGISSLEAAISQAKQRISQYQSTIATLKGKVSQVEQSAGSTSAKAAASRSTAKQHKEDHLEAEERKSVLTQQIKNVAEKLNDVENSIAINERQSNDLSELIERLNALLAAHEKFSMLVDSTQTGFSQVSSLHLDWIEKAKIHIHNNGPVFDRITDYDSYKTEYNKVLSAWAKYPSQGTILVRENSLVESLAGGLRQIREAQALARQMASSQGMAAFRLNSKTDINPLLSDLDVSYSQIFSALDARRQLILKAQQSRRTLIDALAIAWFDLIAIKLHSVNLKDASVLIDEILHAMNDPTVYANFRSNLKLRQKNTEEFSKLLTPLLAQREATSALDYLRDVQTALTSLNLSTSFRSEIEALHKDEKNFFEMSLKNINSTIQTQLQPYFKERIRFVNVLSKRNAEKMNSRCKDLSTSLLGATDPDLQNEIDYLDFRKNCT